jgi:DNA-directed RNA polymerase specialized sigma24 family protein
MGSSAARILRLPRSRVGSCGDFDDQALDSIAVLRGRRSQRKSIPSPLHNERSGKTVRIPEPRSKGPTMFCHAQPACDTSATSRASAQGTPANATTSAGIATQRLSMDVPAPGEHTLGEPARTSRVETEPHAGITERRLLATISRGSRSALRRLHSLYFSRLVKFFVHLAPLSAAEVIEDLVADTMFDVWRTRASLERCPSLHVAIMRIAWAHASTHLAHSEVPAPPLQQSSNGPEPNNWLSSRPEALRPLSDVLATLHVNERAVVHLVHSGHSHQEVADILRMSCHTVNAYLVSSMIVLHPWLAARYSSTIADRPHAFPSVGLGA